jgi:hypothetical protein
MIALVPYFYPSTLLFTFNNSTFSIMAEINAPQPNFNAAAQGLQIAATELRNRTNLPAIRDGVTILEAIRQMEERLTQRIQNLEVSFTLRSLAM